MRQLRPPVALRVVDRVGGRPFTQEGAPAMLVLSRQREETVMIGDDIEVTIVDVRGDKVRLGIRAPKEIAVHRKEVYEAIKRENQAAARLHPQDLPQIPLPQPSLRLSPQSLAVNDAGLQAALEEARQGLAEGGIPIGSVLMREGRIIGRGHNRRVQQNDPMAHAEIEALKNAGRQRTYRDCVLYSTLMPCYLCAGAIVQFGIPRVIVADTVNFKGAGDLLRRQQVEVVDLHSPECIELMRRFIAEHPELWNEDIGK